MTALQRIIHFQKDEFAFAVQGGVYSCLMEIMLAAGVNEITVTSAYRSAHAQRDAMYNNLEAHDSAQGGPAQRTVAKVYREKRAEGASDEEVKDEMLDKINELGPENVSKHSRDPRWITVLDISKKLMQSEKWNNFVNAVRGKMGNRITGFGHFRDRINGGFYDPVFHLEILTDEAWRIQKKLQHDKDAVQNS